MRSISGADKRALTGTDQASSMLAAISPAAAVNEFSATSITRCPAPTPAFRSSPARSREAAQPIGKSDITGVGCGQGNCVRCMGSLMFKQVVYP